MRRFAFISIFFFTFLTCRSVTEGEQEEESETETETSVQTTLQSKSTKNSTFFELDFRVVEHTIPVTQAPVTRPKPTRSFVRRQQILDEDYIFPRQGIEDPYTDRLFNNFTGLEPKRIARKSGKKLHAFIKKLKFRAFIREIDIYVRRIPFQQLFRDIFENSDGLFYRAGFYLLLRAFEFTPTDYFHDFWKKYGVLTVETPATVFIFAIQLHPDAQGNLNVTHDIVDGPSGAILPRDTKTILCAGITFDTDFDCKIRHWKAVLRDKTLLKDQNVTKIDR